MELVTPASNISLTVTTTKLVPEKAQTRRLARRSLTTVELAGINGYLNFKLRFRGRSPTVFARQTKLLRFPG